MATEIRTRQFAIQIEAYVAKDSFVRVIPLVADDDKTNVITSIVTYADSCGLVAYYHGEHHDPAVAVACALAEFEKVVGSAVPLAATNIFAVLIHIKDSDSEDISL